MPFPDSGIERRMREDWNRRAREDANYYVAFGRRDQDEAEFLASAAEVVRGLVRELKHLAGGTARALEIGCGPGRLMRFMSPRFGEVHGVDVSDEMIRLARERLGELPNCHAHHNDGSGLAGFNDDSFDFVYSYAVFQHIPTREVVFNYLAEARRVLKPGGILRCQLNGLPETAARYDTWSGVRLSAAEIAAFARAHDFQLLALEGVSTQYLWTTWRKKPAGWVAGLAGRAAVESPVRLRRITNAHSSEPVAPSRGRFSSIAMWLEGLPADCDLNHLDTFIGGRKGAGIYLGAPECDGLQQFNAALPEGLSCGLQPVELVWLGVPLCAGSLRVIPPGPAVPRVVALSDGIDLLAGTRIVTGTVKVTLEEAAHPEEFRATVTGLPVREIDIFCTDPLPPRHEINFHLPEALPPGVHTLEMSLGRRRFAPVALETAYSISNAT